MKEPFGTPIKPAAGAELGFPRSARILRPAEFRTTYDQGLRIPGPLFAAFCKARPAPEVESEPGRARKSAAPDGPRLGLTVPRAIGGAVVRNRIKRRLREVFRLHRAELGLRWDIVLNPRRAALTASFSELERAFGKVIEKCGP